ncbi:MAG: NAD(P)H-hydrate dehydratase [Gemmatimonadota bacterium]|nr:NAD(P)H-hydrate dehydratase [Gemmatimonadota bacterium]
MIPVLSPEQSNNWDRLAVSAGVELATLMENAGRAVAVVLADRYPHLLRSGVLVAAGPGNNGGDGWVVARALHHAEIPVWVASSGPGSEPRERVAKLARAEGVREVGPDGPWPSIGLAIDALLGTGASGAPRAAVAALVARLVDLDVPILAIDGPTGVDLLSGAVHGVTRADLTVTFGGFRRGHLLARDEVGDVVVVDIGHPPADPSWPVLVTDIQAAQWMRRLRARDHKGARGRVVVVGGATGMSGAVRMAARAACGAGAGLVHVVAPPDTVAALIQAEPDVQTFAHSFEEPPPAALLELIERADSVIIGPGLGRAPGRRNFITALVEASRAVVLDADALTAFGGATGELLPLAAGRPLVLTPHPGEFRSLFPALAGTRELDPWAAAAAAAQETSAVILLKGVPTVIASRQGQLLTIVAGNPGLATGGSGDVLSGLVAGNLASGLDPDIAAALGAQALGRAADLAARRYTARSLRPMDVVQALPDLWRYWVLLSSAAPPPHPPVMLELLRPQTT